MEIKDMSNNELFREYEFTKREIKNLMSTEKQIEAEISKRFDEGRLSDEV